MADQKQFRMDPNYNTVAERIVECREKYPDGRLRPVDPDKPYDLIMLGGNPAFVVVAAFYRSPEDTMPGIGMAYEPIPGSTPYTRGSELQNAETAAWGRAMIAALAADAKKGIASAEEVRAQEARGTSQAGRTRPNGTVQGQSPTEGGQGRQNGTQGQPGDSPEMGPFADWYVAINDAKDGRDLARLHQLWNEAKQNRLPPEVLQEIKLAGDVVRAMIGEGQEQ